VAVTSIVPKGGEVHTFDPTPSDVARLADAELIVMNGLGLDDWLLDLIEGAGSDAPVVRLAEDLPGVEYIAGDHPDEPVNPHLWLDVANAQEYVTRIGDALAAADASRPMAYLAGAVAYGDVLATLDAEVRAAVDAIPATDRKVVSFHEAFPYYAAAYGLTVVDTIVDAPGQDPSAGEIADLVAAIEASGVRAILSEAQFSDALVRTIADETGAAVVDDLYTDSLGDPPVDTYEGLIRWDTDRIVEALG
jgi:ABC-type Zn uptake system ZnuABC Zn-binding protein ZnuA